MEIGQINILLSVENNLRLYVMWDEVGWIQYKCHWNRFSSRDCYLFFSQIIRQDVYTDMNVVPILPLRKYDSSGRVRRLNSFALDFYKHGSSEAIVNENE